MIQLPLVKQTLYHYHFLRVCFSLIIKPDLSKVPLSLTDYRWTSCPTSYLLNLLQTVKILTMQINNAYYSLAGVG